MQGSWDQFWRRNTGGPFTKVSWSKRRIIEVLCPYVGPKCVVLDAGSGSGFFSAFFIDQGCETYSLDYSEQALVITRERTGNRSAGYLCQDLLESSFVEIYLGKFDLVFSDGLFEHFSPVDQRRLFQHFRMAKKPNGLIVTFVPNRNSWWTLARPLFMPGIQEKPFTLAQLEQMYTENGCSVLESGGINVLPVRYSPDALLGRRFGMLVYAVGR